MSGSRTHGWYHAERHRHVAVRSGDRGSAQRLEVPQHLAVLGFDPCLFLGPIRLESLALTLATHRSRREVRAAAERLPHRGAADVLPPLDLGKAQTADHLLRGPRASAVQIRWNQMDGA